MCAPVDAGIGSLLVGRHMKQRCGATVSALRTSDQSNEPAAPRGRRLRRLGTVVLLGLLLASLGGCAPGATKGGSSSTSVPANPITEFPVGGAVQQPSNITSDANGTLWFTG